MKSFETFTFGKWILAGEHSVLRGSPALVFPLKSRILKFLFRPDPLARELKLKSDGPIGKELELLFWGVFKKALEMKNQSNDPFKGEVFIQSEIPLGAGLGASASLCVATTRWFQSMGLVSESEKHEFARELENMFHGESSGVDIAVVTEETGLRFLKQGPRSFLAPSWKPLLFISLLF